MHAAGAVRYGMLISFIIWSQHHTMIDHHSMVTASYGHSMRITHSLGVDGIRELCIVHPGMHLALRRGQQLLGVEGGEGGEGGGPLEEVPAHRAVAPAREKTEKEANQVRKWIDEMTKLWVPAHRAAPASPRSSEKKGKKKRKRMRS